MVNTLKPSTKSQGEKRVSLHNLTWENYQQILAALPSTPATHLTYDRGTLEISMPLEDHEQASELIGLLIRILVVEMGLKLKAQPTPVPPRKSHLVARSQSRPATALTRVGQATC